MFPLNATHLLQPLDAAVLSCLKRSWLESYTRQMNGIRKCEPKGCLIGDTFLPS